MHLDSLRRLVDRAIRSGATRVSLTRWEWNIAGSCQDPVTRELFARKDREGRSRVNDWKPGDDVPLTLIMHLRCRHCQDCKRLRRREWTLRATVELSRSTRTWFGTLTLSPETSFRCEVLARKRLLSGGTVWEKLRPEARYGETCQEIAREITLYLKRLRKQSGAWLRYMACFEKHRSGVPHVHMLLHEVGCGEVRKKQLDEHWSHMGFTHWRLVSPEHSPRAATYVAKYISKDGGRVRASIHYGKPDTSSDIAPAGAVRENAPSVRRARARRDHDLPHSPDQTRPCAYARSLSIRIGDKFADIVDTADW